MKDVYEVLRLKESEISRVATEVEALVAPLLSDDKEEEAHDSGPTADPLNQLTADRPGSRGKEPQSPARPLP